ncbi:hypothetical protein GCM10023085_32190 [Actinomadura viridis]
MWHTAPEAPSRPPWAPRHRLEVANGAQVTGLRLGHILQREAPDPKEPFAGSPPLDLPFLCKPAAPPEP